MHEDDLTPDSLRKYKAQILPNVALLSDAQCQQLRAYADSGGSLLATFKISLFDERGKARADFGLTSLFGVHKNCDRKGPNRERCSYSGIERQHEIALLTGPHWRVPVEAPGQPVLSAIPSYTDYPPALSYSPSGRMVPRSCSWPAKSMTRSRLHHAGRLKQFSPSM